MLRMAAILIALAPAIARADRFEPPSPNAKAQEHYRHGRDLFHDQHYASAAAEFADAYDLDPSSKFLLFNLAVARRLAGDCQQAIDAYREFLAGHPPEQQATNARTGIERCEQTLAQTPPEPAAPTPRLDGATPPAPTPAPHDATPPAPPAPARTVVPTPLVESHWYHDGLGDGLAISGVACVVAGGVLNMLARRAADDTFNAGSLPAFQERRDAASTYETASWITAGTGVALVIVGVIRYTTRPRTAITIVPTHGGAELAMEVRF
jgi:tetratricopeptide (TPR) repeat protein